MSKRKDKGRPGPGTYEVTVHKKMDTTHTPGAPFCRDKDQRFRGPLFPKKTPDPTAYTLPSSFKSGSEAANTYFKKGLGHDGANPYPEPNKVEYFKQTVGCDFQGRVASARKKKGGGGGGTTSYQDYEEDEEDYAHEYMHHTTDPIPMSAAFVPGTVTDRFGRRIRDGSRVPGQGPCARMFGETKQSGAYGPILLGPRPPKELRNWYKHLAEKDTAPKPGKDGFKILPVAKDGRDFGLANRPPPGKGTFSTTDQLGPGVYKAEVLPQKMSFHAKGGGWGKAARNCIT